MGSSMGLSRSFSPSRSGRHHGLGSVRGPHSSPLRAPSCTPRRTSSTRRSFRGGRAMSWISWRTPWALSSLQRSMKCGGGGPPAESPFRGPPRDSSIPPNDNREKRPINPATGWRALCLNSVPRLARPKGWDSVPSISIAEELAKKQREISVSEFFERNKQILGYDSPTRALLTVVKEAVDNSLDAASDADILPEILVEVRKTDKDEFRVVVEDNGPGIVKREVQNVFGRLLYGSRFHSLVQSRGQQGLGISGAIMYGQITTGKPATIRTKTAEMDVAYEVDLIVDTRRNKPSVQREEFKVWDKPHGTRVEIPLKSRYITGKQSVQEYLRSTAIVNPHARIVFQPPEGEAVGFERVTNELPPKTVPIKPHPYGVQIGTLLGMAKETKSYKLSAFLEEEFSRISPRVSKEICEVAGVAADMRPKTLSLEQAKAIVDAIPKVKVMAPPTDCLSPIGERLIKRGLKNVLGALRPEFYSPPVSRDPAVWQGNPFQVEVGIVFGGNLPGDQPVEVLRFANRVPLLYQAGACATAQAVQSVDWRRYGLEQRGGEGIPYGAAIILVHVCSTKIPYTNEAKEAIAPMPEILEQLDLALKESGRRLNTHLEKRARRVKTNEKFEIVQKVLPLIAKKSATVVNKKVPNLDATVTKIMCVVWSEEVVTFKDGTHTVTIDVHNFTPTGKKLNLHALLPGKESKLGKVTPKPADIREDGKITWELKRIGSVEKETVTFEVTGLDKGEYDETDLYVSGISPDLVIGAEPLPGDWELNYKEFEAEEEAPPPEEEEGEVDYDEAEEKLGDE